MADIELIFLLSPNFSLLNDCVGLAVISMKVSTDLTYFDKKSQAPVSGHGCREIFSSNYLMRSIAFKRKYDGGSFGG
ncbi:hypothetical protein [Pseudorhodobacter sp.]|uniref:hypothetical protein n=1 Tax=Pseudorhodobacter sp. TaxID=1934400 RepID=UPI00264870DD|nr:hypothetical protein [Pseudorhodobacter sp.]MDN5786979.1 hypothetical protein [Pseudorhodobacter sp.]